MYKAQGKLEEAAAMYKKSLDLKIKTLGEEHPSVATTYNNLANVSHVTAMLPRCDRVGFDADDTARL